MSDEEQQQQQERWRSLIAILDQCPRAVSREVYPDVKGLRARFPWTVPEPDNSNNKTTMERPAPKSGRWDPGLWRPHSRVLDKPWDRAKGKWWRFVRSDYFLFKNALNKSFQPRFNILYFFLWKLRNGSWVCCHTNITQPLGGAGGGSEVQGHLQLHHDWG